MDVYIYPKSTCCNDRFWPIPIPKIMGNLWETIVKHMVEFWEEWLRSSKKCSNSGEIWRESKRQFIWYRFRQGGGPQNNFLSLLVASMFWVNGRCCHVCKPDRTRPQGSRWPIRTVKIPMDQLYFLVVSTSSKVQWCHEMKRLSLGKCHEIRSGTMWNSASSWQLMKSRPTPFGELLGCLIGGISADRSICERNPSWEEPLHQAK